LSVVLTIPFGRIPVINSRVGPNHMNTGQDTQTSTYTINIIYNIKDI